MSHFIEDMGLPRYRANQLLHWIYQRYVSEINDITEFSKDLRDRLSRLSYISDLNLVKSEKSEDGTEKFLFSLEDGETIESVLIPDEDRLTLCISSQVGCAMGCCFCLTGKIGLIRNLKAHEIVDQIIGVSRITRPSGKLTNIVFMGMGEPLANFDEVAEALRRATTLIGISKRKITLSTAGLIPKIASLAEKAPEVNLAISLNAATDVVRSEIMPINKKYPLELLIDACRRFPLSPRRRITFEYVLISGVNDSADDAECLSNLLKGLKCKINLIPLNPDAGSSLKRPSEEVILVFQKILLRHNLTALIRDSKGQDISAACGQLSAGH